MDEIAVPPDRTVVGRHHQRARVRDVVLGGSGPAGLVICGEPGVGKTMVFDDAVRQARDAGHRVLVARCFEEEMTAALVALTDLVDGLEGHDARSLDPGVSPMRRARAVLATFRRAADDGPVLLAIDDLQWIDDLSARTLRHALRRLGGLRVVVLATCRPSGLVRDPLMLRSALGPAHAGTVDLGPLDRGELRQLLQGQGPISPMTLGRLHRVSGGNPMYALELLRSLDVTERTLGLSSSIPLPETLQAAMSRRLDRLDQALVDTLEFMAVSGPVTVDQLQERVPDLVDERLLGDLEERGLVVVDEHGRCRFSHPLFSSTVYGRMDPGRRRRLHADLARELRDPDVRARHVALSTDGPDAEAAATLEAAAERAHVRGAPGAAAMFARHSLRLTPPDDLELSKRRGLIELTSLAAAGEVARARAVLDRMVATMPPGPARADVLLQRFYVAAERPSEGEATLRQALAEAGDDPRLRGHVLDIMGFHRGVFDQDLETGRAHVADALAVAESSGDEHLWVRAAGHLAHMQAMAGEPNDVLMRASMDRSRELGGPALGGGPHAWWAKQLLWAGDVDGSRRVLDQVLAWDARRGYRLERSYRLYDLALLSCAVGDFDEAGRLVARGIEEAEDSGNRDSQGWLLYPAAVAASWCGRRDEATVLVEDLLGWEGTPGGRLGRARARGVLGLSALGRGDPDHAVRDLRAARDLVGPTGLAHPGALPVLPDLALALAAADCLDEAGEVAAQLAEQARALGQPRPVALSTWVSGVVRAASGDVGAGLEALSRAATSLTSLGLRPDAARCRLDEGRLARRAGLRSRAARALASARDAFAELGAPEWEALAGAELTRVVPDASDGPLTTTERRVAGLVADGLTNREVATRAFMGVSTVEAHLTRIYRKLGIRSRTDLARLVADGLVDVEPCDDLEGAGEGDGQGVGRGDEGGP